MFGTHCLEGKDQWTDILIKIINYINDVAWIRSEKANQQ